MRPPVNPLWDWQVGFGWFSVRGAGGEQVAADQLGDFLETFEVAVKASDGRNFKMATQAAEASLYWEFHELGGCRALRSGGWKLVQYGLMPGEFGNCELYDLAGDLSESGGLSEKRPERIATILKIMNAARKPRERFPLPGLDALGE